MNDRAEMLFQLLGGYNYENGTSNVDYAYCLLEK